MLNLVITNNTLLCKRLRNSRYEFTQHRCAGVAGLKPFSQINSYQSIIKHERNTNTETDRQETKR